MSTLRELDASAEAAEACERAAVALKRATRDVEASARGFGLEPDAVARARELCAEVTRLASRADAAIAAAQDAAALEASEAIHGAFLTPAEDRAATRERLASAPAEPVRVFLVRFSGAKKHAVAAKDRESASPTPPTPFLFHRRRAGPAGRALDSDADADAARAALRALLLEARRKLDAPVAVAGLYRADGSRVADPNAVRDGETLVAKLAFERMAGDDARSGTPKFVTRLAAANARRDAGKAAPAFAVDATPVSRPSSVAVESKSKAPPVRPASAPAARGFGAEERTNVARSAKAQSARASELARPKPVWVRSFAVRLRVVRARERATVAAAAAAAAAARPEDAQNEKARRTFSMRVPEKGLEGMSLATLRRRVALACGFAPGANLPLRLELGAGRTELRPPAELAPGCALAVFADEKSVGTVDGAPKTSPSTKKNFARGVGGVGAALDFAPCSPAGKATRARIERLREEERGGSRGAASDATNENASRSPFGPSRARSARRNPYGVDPFAFADGRFDFSPAATSPRPPRKPDRFPMSALTAKDVRRARTPRARAARVPTKPVVGEYSFGSRIRFDPAMLPPARRFSKRVAVDRRKKKPKKKAIAAKKKQARSKEEAPEKTPAETSSAEKKRFEPEEEAHEVEPPARFTGGASSGGVDLAGASRDARRLPPKTPIRGFDVAETSAVNSRA